MDIKLEKYRFYKEDNGNWYVDLPGWPGAKSDLLMIGGADTMLDILSNEGKEVEVVISGKEFDGADLLQFKAPAEDVGEGAYYHLEEYDGESLKLQVFLCDVTKWVFGGFPEKLFIKTVKS